MAKGPENHRKRNLIVGAAGALAVAGLAASALHAEKPDVDAEKPAGIEQKAQKDAGVQGLRDGLGKVIKFVVQDGGGNEPTDKVDSGPSDEETARSLLEDALAEMRSAMGYDVTIYDSEHPAEKFLGSIDSANEKEPLHISIVGGPNKWMVAKIFAEPNEGTLNVTVYGYKGTEHVVSGVEPYNIPLLFRECNNLHENTQREMNREQELYDMSSEQEEDRVSQVLLSIDHSTREEEIARRFDVALQDLMRRYGKL